MKNFIKQAKQNIYTKNIFIESHNELNISLFVRELNNTIINKAYEKLLNECVKCIENGIAPSFKITDKKEAKDYLINIFHFKK